MHSQPGMGFSRVVETISLAGLMVLIAACAPDIPSASDGQAGGDGGVTAADSGGAIWAEAGIVLLPDMGPSQLEITSPARGATLTGASTVEVKGTATGQLRNFTINGAAVQAAADGSLSHTIEARHGMNLIVAQYEGEGGVIEKQVRAFYYAKSWRKADTMLEEAAVAWLGQPVFDDKNPQTTSDFASVIERVLGGLDVASLVPQKQQINDVAGCDKADIEISNIQYGPPKVSVDVQAGALLLKATLTNFEAKVKADLDGDWYNPACAVGVSGKVKASSIEITANVKLWVEGGTLHAQATQTTAQVNGFDIDIGGIWGFLTNWLINTFEGDLEQDLEQKLKEELDNQLGPLLSKGLGDLALDESLAIDPFFGEGEPVVLDLVTQPGALVLQQGGVRYAMSAKATAPAKIQPSSLGSISNLGCSGAASGAFAFRNTATNPLQIALSDDLVNQALYSLHAGGLLQMRVTQQDYAEQLQKMGIGGLEADVDALLPPILNSCLPDQQALLQLGALRLRVKFELIGQPVEMEVHFAAEAPVQLEVREDAQGQRLRLAIAKISRLEVDSKNLASGEASVYDAMKQMLDTQLLPQLTVSLSEKAVSFKIPSIELSKLHASMPAGSVIRLSLAKVEQRDGYAVVMGGLATTP